MIHFSNQVRLIQFRMTGAVTLNKFKYQWLKDYFKKEVHEYQVQLQPSKKKKDKILCKRISKINIELQEKLLFLYLERCKYINSLAFM